MEGNRYFLISISCLIMSEVDLLVYRVVGWKIVSYSPLASDVATNSLWLTVPSQTH